MQILPNLTQLLEKDTSYIILVKPQFEAEKHMVGFGGIVSNPDHLAATLSSVENKFKDQGFEILQKSPSKVKGTKGNQEYFYLVKPTSQP